LPADLLAFGNLPTHGLIIFTAGAIIIIVAIFEFYDTGLHPKTGIGRFGLLVRLDQPYLTTENRLDFLLGLAITPVALFVSGPESHMTSLFVFLVFSHLPRSFSK
jgi:hypothetical protein